jgi:hypothetical protein
MSALFCRVHFHVFQILSGTGTTSLLYENFFQRKKTLETTVRCIEFPYKGRTGTILQWPKLRGFHYALLLGTVNGTMGQGTRSFLRTSSTLKSLTVSSIQLRRNHMFRPFDWKL